MNSIPFLEEALGQVLTSGLMEIANSRYKYPTLSIRETGLKLLALYLKTHNPNNTKYMARKYREKMKKFIDDCEIPSRIYHEGMRKEDTLVKGGTWEEAEEESYIQLSEKYDELIENLGNKKEAVIGTYFR